jgi:hypothetical protein
VRATLYSLSLRAAAVGHFSSCPPENHSEVFKNGPGVYRPLGGLPFESFVSFLGNASNITDDSSSGYVFRTKLKKITYLKYISYVSGSNILGNYFETDKFLESGCGVGWVDIGSRTKVPLKFVTYLSKITNINEKSVLTQ